MKTIVVSNRSREMKKLLKLAKQQDIVVKTPTGEEFVLSAVDDLEYEISRQRRNKKLMAFLDRRFRAARREKGIPLAIVKQKLGLNSHG